MPPKLQHPPTFTIGCTEGYLEEIANCQSQGEILLKKGMHDNYPGGIVFQNPIDARRYIDDLPKNGKAYSVFEIDADWEQDCYEQTDLFDDCYWKYLIGDRPIVCLVEDA